MYGASGATGVVPGGGTLWSDDRMRALIRSTGSRSDERLRWSGEVAWTVPLHLGPVFALRAVAGHTNNGLADDLRVGLTLTGSL